MSKLFTLNLSDFTKAFLFGGILAALCYIASALNIPGFDFASLNGEIMKILSAAVLAYLTKNLITDSEGKILGAYKL